MKARILFISVIVMGLVLALTGAPVAQEPPPPDLPKLPPEAPSSHRGGPYQTPDGLWVMPADARPPMEAAGVSPQATGGPDDFGYTWDDGVPFSWIDATTGTDSGLSGDDRFTGPIDIGFNFRFYENTYEQLYISTNGLVSFGQGFYHWSNQSIPNTSPPNNFIAPFWDDLAVGEDYNSGKVYYKQYGSAPNRYFVIEWWNVTRLGSSDLLTFEVILHENGDIVMQYLSLSGNLQSATVGIEDDMGVTGLQYLHNAPGLGNNKAVRFYRPGPLARVKLWPLYQGRFTRAGATESFPVSIRNTGELGNDTYDLFVSSPWSVGLYAADGVTSLTDTDGDGTVDTGPVAQGSTVTVTVKVQTPNPAGVGANNTAAITARSSRDTTKSKTATLQTAVPAPFAQVYRDNADGAMSLYLVQPAAQALKKVTADSYYGSEMAVAEAPNGNFVYAWTKGRCLDSACNVYGSEIEYTLLDRYGNTVRGVGKLTNHFGATMTTYDYSPAVAVAPNGRIGVVWYRYLWNRATQQFNYNIWFAILDASGNRIYGPVNLTNNTAWGTWSDYNNVPIFYDPRIAATGDNRFVLAWEREHQVSAGWVSDIYYAVRDTAGNAVKGVTKFTNDTAGDDGYYGPALAALSGNRALLAYSGPTGITYAVLDSGGNTVKSPTATGGGGWGPDAVQLSNGNIVIAWTSWQSVIQFAVLDGTYNLRGGPTTLVNPTASTGDGYVSVAADAAGRAILTWMDYDWNNRRNLYYALVGGSGNVLTPPMIFYTAAVSPWGDQYIMTSYEGYGNTSYSWTPPTGVDGVAAFGASLFGGPPNGVAALSLYYANRGAIKATSVILTATLDSNLTYVGDTSGYIPTVSGNDVVWNLPDLDFLAEGRFTLQVGLPDAPIGTRYPVTLTLASAGPEANSSDNTASAQVMVARQVFLPLILKGY